jgi:hypothetical protein
VLRIRGTAAVTEKQNFATAQQRIDTVLREAIQRLSARRFHRLQEIQMFFKTLSKDFGCATAATVKIAHELNLKMLCKATGPPPSL